MVNFEFKKIKAGSGDLTDFFPNVEKGLAAIAREQVVNASKHKTYKIETATAYVEEDKLIIKAPNYFEAVGVINMIGRYLHENKVYPYGTFVKDHLMKQPYSK